MKGVITSIDIAKAIRPRGSACFIFPRISFLPQTSRSYGGTAGPPVQCTHAARPMPLIFRTSLLPNVVSHRGNGQVRGLSQRQNQKGRRQSRQFAVVSATSKPCRAYHYPPNFPCIQSMHSFPAALLLFPTPDVVVHNSCVD